MKNFILMMWSLLVLQPAFAGGVSGGGGNSKPLHPVTAAQVKRAIYDGRRYVTGILNHFEDGRHRDRRWWERESLAAKLFDGQEQIMDWSLKFPVEINETGPCLDPEGKEVDGSAQVNPPSVCMSVPRLVEKLSRESLRGEVLGLLAHEFSHLVGATEEEADYLQNEVIERTFWANFQGFDESVRTFNLYALKKLEFASGSEPLPASPEQWKKFYVDLDWFTRFYNSGWGGRDSQMEFGGRRFWFFSGQVFSREMFLRSATCELAQLKGAEKCKEWMDRIFQNDLEISDYTFHQRLGREPGAPDERPGVVYRRVRNAEDLRVELNRLSQEVSWQYNYIDTLW